MHNVVSMERIKITEEKGVEAFINAQDESRRQTCATFIASRAALRVAPHAIQFYEFHSYALARDLTSCMIWRPQLVSSVAAKMPTNKTIDAAFSVATAAAAGVADAAFAAFADVRAYTAAKAARAADFAATVFDEIWAEVAHHATLWLEHADQGDGTLAITIAPLWSGENPHERDWQHLRENLRAANTPDDRGADWSFWIKWYDDILAGNPQNWDMLHEIATTPDIDWDAPSREVNDKINGIVEKYALRNSYYYERIEFSEAK